MVRRGTFTRRSNAARVYLWSLQLVRFPQWRHERRSAFGARNGDVVSYRSFDDKIGLITANATKRSTARRDSRSTPRLSRRRFSKKRCSPARRCRRPTPSTSASARPSGPAANGNTRCTSSHRSALRITTSWTSGAAQLYAAVTASDDITGRQPERPLSARRTTGWLWPILRLRERPLRKPRSARRHRLRPLVNV